MISKERLDAVVDLLDQTIKNKRAYLAELHDRTLHAFDRQEYLVLNTSARIVEISIEELLKIHKDLTEENPLNLWFWFCDIILL